VAIGDVFQFADQARQRIAVHIRKIAVHQDHVERFAAHGAQRGRTIHAGGHLATDGQKLLLDQKTVGGVVFNQKNRSGLCWGSGFAAWQRGVRTVGARRRIDCVRRAVGGPWRYRNRERYRGAHIHFAMQLNAAAHQFDQLPADGKAESGAAIAAGNGGVGLRIGMKQAFAAFGGNADAGIAYFHEQLHGGHRRAAFCRASRSTACDPQRTRQGRFPRDDEP
jgi:hypothetical protein